MAPDGTQHRPAGAGRGDPPSLFEPFRRLSDERVHQRDGAGLGLSIARSIVAAHHGRISVRAGKIGGLVVEVQLP